MPDTETRWTPGDTRWRVEYTPEGESEPTVVIERLHDTDDQFVLNAAAWLREMFEHGDIIIRELGRWGMGWQTKATRKYEL